MTIHEPSKPTEDKPSNGNTKYPAGDMMSAGTGVFSHEQNFYEDYNPGTNYDDRARVRVQMPDV
eukprot:CAMPEP_0184050868 /NCGR_PEP_ID=MMETSP0956-20121227/4325_1 /TAXON_ID=627963 /ORGANISM="Aplanochytrium sp, Strain PBS07" /LENGTH=63 /DNA_ID=CAMNT_0026343559 /DNA_START=450 /DNA_END=642 /DNA_ORIENTATION=-